MQTIDKGLDTGFGDVAGYASGVEERPKVGGGTQMSAKTVLKRKGKNKRKTESVKKDA